MLAGKFIEIFRTEHRTVRDMILSLIRAFRARDIETIRSELNNLASITGPHFRYEEEALYPELTAFFTEQYVEKLMSDHDMAIENATELVSLAQLDELSDDDVQRGVRLLQSIMPHVSDCDGLSILIETLPDETISNVFDSRDYAKSKGLGLIDWANTQRSR